MLVNCPADMELGSVCQLCVSYEVGPSVHLVWLFRWLRHQSLPDSKQYVKIFKWIACFFFLFMNGFHVNDFVVIIQGCTQMYCNYCKEFHTKEVFTPSVKKVVFLPFNLSINNVFLSLGPHPLDLLKLLIFFPRFSHSSINIPSFLSALIKGMVVFLAYIFNFLKQHIFWIEGVRK